MDGIVVGNMDMGEDELMPPLFAGEKVGERTKDDDPHCQKCALPLRWSGHANHQCPETRKEGAIWIWYLLTILGALVLYWWAFR